MKEATNNNIWEIATIAFEYCISKQKELKSNGTNFTFQLMTKYNEAVSDNTYDNNIKHEIILDIYKKFQGFSEALNPSKHKDNTKTNDDLEEISWDFSIQPYLENENGKKQLAKLFVFIHELLYNYDIDETIRKRKNMPFEIESKAPYRKMLSMLRNPDLKRDKFNGFFTKFIEMGIFGSNFREKYNYYRNKNITNIRKKRNRLLIIQKNIP